MGIPRQSLVNLKVNLLLINLLKLELQDYDEIDPLNKIGNCKYDLPSKYLNIN